MPKQTIPAGGFEASASGGLHKSSMGETYPWTVQPRIHKYGDESWSTDWVAFNALTGREIGRFLRFEAAEQTCRDMLDIERNWRIRK